MIAGTFIFEDHFIQFCALNGGRVEYTVQDAHSWNTATVNVDMAEFSAAVYVALNGSEGVGKSMYALAEDAMPRARSIHGGSGLAKEDAERIVRHLRWIP